ncbi:MAG: shikimate dehydrogenase [Fibrobacterota bacterium]
MAENPLKKVFLLGHPVGHSKSPLMQNNAFKKCGINAVYETMDVLPADLPRAFEALRSPGVLGANITIPHKTAAAQLVDNLSEKSRIYGAVNTIINRDGKLEGTTTDPEGIIRPVIESGIIPEKSKIMIIGTGGSARTAAYSLALESNASITVAGRSPEKAEPFVSKINSLTKGPAVCLVQLYSESFYNGLKESDLIINATPIGMYPDTGFSVLDKENIPEGKTVFDFVYNPRKTELIKGALKKGCRIIEGLSMLIYQGAASFKLWTGKECPADCFREVFGEFNKEA